MGSVGWEGGRTQGLNLNLTWSQGWDKESDRSSAAETEEPQHETCRSRLWRNVWTRGEAGEDPFPQDKEAPTMAVRTG